MMPEWIKNLFTKRDNGKVVYIEDVTIHCYAGSCNCKPVPPAASRVPPVLGKGDSVLMIKFPVLVEPGVDADIEKTIVFHQVEGVETEVTEELVGNGGSTFITVPENSNGACWSRYIDKAGNPSADSPKAFWTNASDTTPPASAANAPNLGKGQTA